MIVKFLNNVDLPEEDQSLQIQRTLKETEKIQKNPFLLLEDSEEKRKEENNRPFKRTVISVETV